MPPFLTTILIYFGIMYGVALVTIIFHELGHAIPALLFTKGKVTVHIGSHGDSSQCLRIKIMRISFYIKYNPRCWFRGGLCSYEIEDISLRKRIFFLMGGPMATIILTGVSFYVLIKHTVSGPMRYGLLLFVWLGTVYTIYTVFPRKGKLFSAKGQLLNNDAFKILQLIRESKFPPEFHKAKDLYVKKEYEKAGIILEGIIASGHLYPEILSDAVYTYQLSKNYPKAYEFLNLIFKNKYETAEDYCSLGFLQSQTNQQEEALKNYSKAIELNPKHIYALNNYGYTLTTYYDKHEESLNYFDKAISISKMFYHSYNNRGYAKLRMGKLEEGLKDINYSIQLNDSNAEAYRNLGLYHLEKGEKEKATPLLLKAKSMDPDTHNIDYYLNLAS